MTDVAITGWSVLSPLGTTREEFVRGVCEGRSEFGPAAGFDTSALDSHLAAQVRQPVDYKRFIPAARLRRMDGLSRMMAYVACEAFQHAGLKERNVPPERRAIVAASGLNHTESIEQFYLSLLHEGPEGANPIYFPATIPNSAGGLMAIELECRGPNLTLTQKETSAEAAFVIARDLLENDEADLVLLAAGEALTAVVYDGLARLRALSRGAAGLEEGMRPFSRRRNGFVAGEGAAAVVLEQADRAREAGRTSLGRLVGAAESCQTCSPMKYPTEPLGPARAIWELFEAADRDPREIALVNSAANSTRSLDACEADTIRLIADKLGRRENELPVAAIKGTIGEFGAGGLTRILAALGALEAGVCPPLPFEAEAYDCEQEWLQLAYRNAPVALRGNDFLHLATAAGGHQMALWFSRAERG